MVPGARLKTKLKERACKKPGAADKARGQADKANAQEAATSGRRFQGANSKSGYCIRPRYGKKHRRRMQRRGRRRTKQQKRARRERRQPCRSCHQRKYADSSKEKRKRFRVRKYFWDIEWRLAERTRRENKQKMFKDNGKPSASKGFQVNSLTCYNNQRPGLVHCCIFSYYPV